MDAQPKFIPKPGQIDYTNIKRAPVINYVVMHEGKILLVQRNATMHFYPNKWNGISGFLDEEGRTISDKVKEELREELGIEEKNIMSIKERSVIEKEEPQYNKTWLIHPILVEVATNSIRLDWEAQKYEWVEPKAALDFDLLSGFDQVIEMFFPRTS